MKALIRKIFCLGCLLVSSVVFAQAITTADLVLHNGYVYTLDKQRTVAQALAIKGNRIIAVGNEQVINRYIGKQTQLMDLQGKLVLPGLHDAHIHALGTIEQAQCDFNGQAKDLEEMVVFLKNCLLEYPVEKGQWFMAVQWPFSRGNQPSADTPSLRSALDKVSTEHPIILWGDDGHHAAVNSVALNRAQTKQGQTVGLSKQTIANYFADYKTLIGVDQSGEPSGGLTEAARLLVRPPSLISTLIGSSHAPEITMPKVAHKLAESGITSIQDAIVTPESLKMYQWLEDNKQMTFRLRAALFVESDDHSIDGLNSKLTTFKTLRKQVQDYQFIKADAVKLFADGVMEGNPLAVPATLPNAAVLENYQQPIFSNEPNLEIKGYVDLESELCRSVRQQFQHQSFSGDVNVFKKTHGFMPSQCLKSNGVLEHDIDYINQFVKLTTDAGFHVHIHVIGDRAARVAVDAFEKNKDLADKHGLTQSLAHLQLVHPQEQQRIGQLGIYSVFTYAWIAPDVEYAMMVNPFIEQVQNKQSLFQPDSYLYNNTYPTKSIQEAGGILVAGSDAPVDTRDPRPFVNIQQAVTRESAGIIQNPKQQISIHEAIASYTINAAKMLSHEQDLGSLEVGKIADLIVLDQNIIELAKQGKSNHIAKTKVLTTIFDGKIVYQK